MYKFCVWNPFLIHKNLINFWVSSMSSTNLYTDIHFTLKVKIFERTRITPTYATWMIFFALKGEIDLFIKHHRYIFFQFSSLLPFEWFECASFDDENAHKARIMNHANLIIPIENSSSIYLFIFIESRVDM